MRDKRRIGRKYPRGAAFEQMQEVTFRRVRVDPYSAAFLICDGCKNAFPFKRIACDHVIPERLCRTLRITPHVEQNGAALCYSCHAKKTHFAEPPLYRGDFLGFESAMDVLGLNDRAKVAFSFYGFKSNGGK